ncbi:ATP-binding cassette domain-containing protein [Sedimentibacter sp. zth1]|uniref:ABC transporter ATP-binding protein n=1 Tax=Sedimentibacter sp. zth1 TaxID=2816908 RepID=UPI001A916C4A|nr:ATP-binding cassette domain-containing protein [Sedimentibacter sp. zth1]QSX04857.1 ATP-binding cassette domain-containing protein [Sedimentibacter sp. zth1]
MEAFKIENLSFAYPEQDKWALNEINLTIESGEFVTLCGKSGCGKSTLLKSLKPSLAPYGEKHGLIYFKNRILGNVDLREQTSAIGYVLQNPDNQIVTDKVWHELAFGLENLGYDNKKIRLRVAEMASFFGIQEWFMKNVNELSGGQKQLLNLAAIMTMQPSVLILDEPTSQLDPIAAGDFLNTIKKINRDLGTTIILSEHRLEEVFPISDRIVVMDKGKIIVNSTPQNTGKKLKELNHDMFCAMPPSIRICAEVQNNLQTIDYPLTVKESRIWINELFKDKEIKKRSIEAKKVDFNSEEIVIDLKDVWFRYEKNEPDVVKDLSLKVAKGQIYAMAGGNGTGKSTALSIISGINKPYRGTVKIKGKNIKKYTDKELFNENLGVLPQNPQSIFVEMTVREELYEMVSDDKIINEIIDLMEIKELLNMHPYDLSGGEQQKVAFAKVMLLKPKIILLDEPTKALDSHFKIKFADILKKLRAQGATILMVSHDIEFCAEYADMCSLFFNGSIVATNTSGKFFSGNSFYTTFANRMSRHIFNNGVTVEDVIKLCKQNLS